MTEKTKKLLKFSLRFLVTACLLAIVFSQLDIKQFSEALRTTRWEFVIALWATAIIVVWINSIKLKFILKKQNLDTSTSLIFGASCVTALYSLIMPDLLSTGAKWYIIKKDTGKGERVLTAMFYNQLSILVVITILGLIAVIVENPAAVALKNPANTRLVSAICILLILFIITVIALLLTKKIGNYLTKFLLKLSKILPEKTHKTSQQLIEQIEIIRSAGLSFHLTATFYTILGNFIGSALAFLFAAKAANIDAPWTVFVWLSSLVFLLSRIPVSIANWGPREASLVGLLAIYGVETASALLMSFIVFSTAVVLAIVGAVFQIMGFNKKADDNAINTNK